MNTTQCQWSMYIENIGINNNKIVHKMKYVQCDHNIKKYVDTIGHLINENTFVYICIPPQCYKIILEFKNIINKGNFILEKLLALSYCDFIDLKPYLKFRNIVMLDHFLYKKDVQSMVKYVNNMIEPIKTIVFRFLYTDDVESRLEYFDKTGFFIDMFQSHFLSILQCLIKDNIQNITKGFVQGIRRQYIGYGGKNKESDTYFNIKIITKDYEFIFEAGKSMQEKKKEIIINGIKFVINDYADEYSTFFQKHRENCNIKNVLENQETYWKITEYVRKNFKSMEYYEKSMQTTYFTPNIFNVDVRVA